MELPIYCLAWVYPHTGSQGAALILDTILYIFFKDHEHRETVSFKERWKTHFYSNIRDYRYKLVYKKKNIIEQKYYSGGPGKIMNVPVVHCSGVQQPFRQTDRYGVSSICVMEITPVLPGSS